MRLDSHQHYWTYNSRDFPWLSGQYAALQRNYLPAQLSTALQANRISGTIAVQARQLIQESYYLLELMQKTPSIKGVVGWVDLSAPDVDELLSELSRQLVGVRHIIHDEPDIGFMLRPDFRRGITQLHRKGLTYDLLIKPEHLLNSIKLVDQFPQQLFVIDHIAKPELEAGIQQPWAQHLKALAERENVFCKLSGMVTEANYSAWQGTIPQTLFMPYINTVLEAFGTNRIMFGSNWPLCTLAASYDQVTALVESAVKQLSDTEQADVMGNTAMRFYNIS